MIITTKPIKYQLKVSNNPIEEFLSSNNDNESRFFSRFIGVDNTEIRYLEMLKRIDEVSQSSGSNYFKVINKLPTLSDISKVDKCKTIVKSYIKKVEFDNSNNSFLNDIDFNIDFNNDRLNWTLKKSFHETLSLFKSNNTDSNTTGLITFGTKILYWIKYYDQKIISINTHNQNKFLYYGNIKKHEVYFLILLSKIGFDVLYINPVQDIDTSYPYINKYSSKYINGETGNKVLDFPKPERKVTQVIIQNNKPIEPKTSKLNIRKPPVKSSSEINQKTYEEIALFAESVVMIKVFDNNNKVIGSGSGVVISNDGFIITNFHVVGNGAVFEVIFENDDTKYKTTHLVKYHQDFDLALIKVDRTSIPIRLSEKELVRGQKIVSIGSPLGLFNTISEGIVSGFRSMGKIDMVQISAPISPGSSGGALLDMYGNLAGITTSGFDGQNLNLTVPSKYIKLFAGNII